MVDVVVNEQKVELCPCCVLLCLCLYLCRDWNVMRFVSQRENLREGQQRRQRQTTTTTKDNNNENKGRQQTTNCQHLLALLSPSFLFFTDPLRSMDLSGPPETTIVDWCKDVTNAHSGPYCDNLHHSPQKSSTLVLRRPAKTVAHPGRTFPNNGTKRSLHMYELLLLPGGIFACGE